jgi:tRNA (mo5U34)-methyltransferase
MTTSAVEFSARQELFRIEIDALKRRLGSGIQWYPYQTLSLPLELLCQSEHLLSDGLAGGLVADLACADGDLAFFLERLGCKVHAMDHPPANYNRMTGVRMLKESLGSSVEVYERDLDSAFTLPSDQYDLAFFLGVLYHLRNPYQALELLARHTRFCVLNTRIAKYTPEGKRIQNMPVGYLLDYGEANNDPSNYWVFSEQGLRRLLDRTGWNVCAWTTTGDTRRSDPVSKADERAYCVIESRVRAGFGPSVKLIKGWHQIEHGGWRWTERCFSALMKPAGPLLKLAYTLPENVVSPDRPLMIGVTAGDIDLGADTVAAAGEHVYSRVVPQEALRDGAVLVQFVLDRAIPPSELDARELGLVVTSISLGL